MRSKITNNRTNTLVLVPGKQQLIDNTATADVNNVVSEIKAVLAELHNKVGKASVKTKQKLLSAMSTADHNGNITNNIGIKFMDIKLQEQINHVKSSTTVMPCLEYPRTILNTLYLSDH